MVRIFLKLGEQKVREWKAKRLGSDLELFMIQGI